MRTVCWLYLALNCANKILVLSEPNNQQIGGLCQGCCCNYALFSQTIYFWAWWNILFVYPSMTIVASAITMSLFGRFLASYVSIHSFGRHSRANPQPSRRRWWMMGQVVSWTKISKISYRLTTLLIMKGNTKSNPLPMTIPFWFWGWIIDRIMDSWPGNGHLVIHLDDSDYYRHN